MEQKKFVKSMAKTYIAATAGTMVSSAAMRGLRGAATPYSFKSELLGGMQVGTAFIAYDVACNLAARYCPQFKKEMEDPNGCKVKVYVVGGTGAAVILSLVNTTLGKIQESLTTKGVKFCPRDYLRNFIVNVPANIGFAATMGALQPIVPVPRNSLAKYARDNLVLNAANIGSMIAQWPVLFIREKASLPAMLAAYPKGILGMMIGNDFTARFSDVLRFMTE